MKNLFSLFTALVLSALITGCDEYSSPVPAGKLKESKIDTNYIGCWNYTGLVNENDTSLSGLDPHYLYVVRFDDNRYILSMLKKDSLKPTSLPGIYEATTCKLGGKNIVSVRTLSGVDKSEYLIYMYNLESDTLWYCAFQKSKLDKQFSKTSALKKYLLKYLNDTSVLLPRKKYVRVK